MINKVKDEWLKKFQAFCSQKRLSLDSQIELTYILLDRDAWVCAEFLIRLESEGAAKVDREAFAKMKDTGFMASILEGPGEGKDAQKAREDFCGDA